MILKGNQRGGGQQLATHLMNSFDNERVEIADMRGAIAQDLSGAFAEWSAQARATRCKKNLYSLSLNPDQAQGHLTREQYLELLDRTERSLKLVDQPRAVVFHEKRDTDGVLREHCHAVWSRIDTDKMKAVQMSHDRLKLRSVARDFCRDHGLELPDGMKPGKSKGSRRPHFNQYAKEDYAERQQKERTGIPKADRMADIATCWKETGNGAAFVAALEGKGYYLARGDSRSHVVLDLHGEIHSLSRQLKGVASLKEMRQRLVDHHADKLPDVETTRAFLDDKRRDAVRAAVAQKEPSQAEKRRQALLAHQQQRRDELDHKRTDLIVRHSTERDGLKAAQEAQNTGIVSARLQRQPKGFMAFLTRITGIKMLVEARHKQQDQARQAEHQQQTEALKRTHDRELHEIARRSRALTRMEARENRSAETALKREEFQNLVQKRQLKPEFDRATQQQQQGKTTEEGRSLKDSFDKAPKPAFDLTEAFNREVENRINREEREKELDGPERNNDPRKR